MNPVLYNEIDPYASQWLRNLSAAGAIPAGIVDTTSIVDLDPANLAPYRQIHFFAGIGGWAYALRLAGWPDTREVWTGSCPCQPLSSAGQRKGHADERHLWPAFYRLIAERRPAIVFGEQVAGKLGREWLAGVRADLEDLGYAIGAADLCAAGGGAPHIRQRLYWVAQSQHAERWPVGVDRPDGRDRPNGGWPETHGEPRTCGEVLGLADANWGSRQGRELRGMDGEEKSPIRDRAGEGDRLGFAPCDRPDERMADPERIRQPRGCGRVSEDGTAPRGPDAGDSSRTGDAGSPRLSPRERGELSGPHEHDEGRATGEPGRSPWAAAEWLSCLDGKSRRAQSGIFPLADGLPLAMDGLGPVSRIGTLRGAGNAIVPQTAVIFIRALMECL